MHIYLCVICVLILYNIFQASRAQILKQATDYITFMSKKNGAHQSDIDDLKKQNNLLEQQGMIHYNMCFATEH